MTEYYESATVLSIAGPRQFGIRGWQAASRMIKKVRYEYIYILFTIHHYK